MGRYSYEQYDPYDLDFPNDIDFELEGIDEDYGMSQEYVAFMPDRISQLRPVDSTAIDACKSASNAIAAARGQLAGSNNASAIASLLLYVEAVSTTQLENYPATCTRTLDYIAAVSLGGAFLSSETEAVATDAVSALRAFVTARKETVTPVTLNEICDTNALFAHTSPRAEYCGEIRERPVFIGRSLFDAEFVPPPADALDDYMDDLIRFINGHSSMDPIAKAAIAQAQFVTVHPFEDGNGRICRVLSQRILGTEGITDGFMLPISAVMAMRKSEYIDALQCMKYPSGPSDPSQFVRFFSECCKDAADLVVAMEERVENTVDGWARSMPALDEAVKDAMNMFVATPILTEAMLLSALPEGASTTLNNMLSANILQKRRSAFCGSDVYVAADILEILEDTQSGRGDQ